jgi:hypothetical protein
MYGATAEGAPSPSTRLRTKTPIPPSHNFSSSPHLCTLSAIYLMDWEAGRAPSIDIKSATAANCNSYLIRKRWRKALISAILLLFSSSFWEHGDGWIVYAIDTGGSIAISIDLILLYSYQKRRERMRWSMVLTAGFLVLHLLELLIEFLALRHLVTSHKVIVTSVLKPIVLFYAFPISSSLAFSTLCKILPTAFLIFGLELAFILFFAAVAKVLFAEDPDFGNGLGESFITLFALSTSVNNPSCWMGRYLENKVNAVFFVLFLLMTRFYVHSVVLGLILYNYKSTLKHSMAILEAERKVSGERQPHPHWVTVYKRTQSKQQHSRIRLPQPGAVCPSIILRYCVSSSN